MTQDPSARRAVFPGSWVARETGWTATNGIPFPGIRDKKKGPCWRKKRGVPGMTENGLING